MSVYFTTALQKVIVCRHDVIEAGNGHHLEHQKVAHQQLLQTRLEPHKQYIQLSTVKILRAQIESIVGAANIKMEHTRPIAFFRICRYASIAFDLVTNPMGISLQIGWG